MTSQTNDTHRPRVALVGHCGFDSGGLKDAVQRALPGAHVERANVQDELVTRLGEFDLLLVNRVLDGRFETQSGIEFLRWLDTADLKRTPARLLVSNLPAAQDEAESVGAAPGFGKDDLRSAETERRIREAVGR